MYVSIFRPYFIIKNLFTRKPINCIDYVTKVLFVNTRKINERPYVLVCVCICMCVNENFSIFNNFSSHIPLSETSNSQKTSEGPFTLHYRIRSMSLSGQGLRHKIIGYCRIY